LNFGFQFVDLGVSANFSGAISVAANISQPNGFVSNQWLPTLEATSGALGNSPNAANIAGTQHATLFLGIEGDLNHDGSIDAGDLALLLGSWGLEASISGYLAADLDRDGSVGAADLAALLSRWGA
jgi:hypothetical protein